MNWPLMCPPDLPGSAVGLRVLTTDLTFRRKPLPGFKWPLILIDWFMCFGALVCIFFTCSIVFNHVQSIFNSFTMIPDFLSQRPPKFTGHKKIASRNSRWQIPGTASSPVSESSHSQNQLPQIGHRKVSIFIYLQDLLRDNMRSKTILFIGHIPGSQQIHIVCWQFFEVELWLFSPFWFTLNHDIEINEDHPKSRHFCSWSCHFSMAEASVRGQVEWPSRGVRMLSPCHGSAELVELMENYRKHMKTVLEYDSVWYSDGVQSSTMDYGEYGRGWSSSVQKDTPNFLTVFFEPTIMGRNSKKMQKVKWQRTTSSVVREPEDHGEY